MSEITQERYNEVMTALHEAYIQIEMGIALSTAIAAAFTNDNYVRSATGEQRRTAIDMITEQMRKAEEILAYA